MRNLTGQAPPTSDLVTVFAGLGKLVYDEASYDDILSAVTRAAQTMIEGCDHASIMLADQKSFTTVAASDDVARQVDQLERELRDGPCVDAITEETFQLDPDLTDGSQWPVLAKAVVDQTMVRGMAGYRLSMEGKKLGALNIFSDTPNALTQHAADQGAVLAAFASVALGATKRRQEIESLKHGLVSNREIGKATGLLMSAYKIDADEAFARLRRTSNDLNIKLAEVAREMVDYHNLRGDHAAS